MPCKAGTRERIEESKRRYAREKELEKACPFRALWRALHQKVFAENGGFESLSSAEQRYWAVGVLEGEVCNGGFDQFFYNSSGALLPITIEALNELGAKNALSLLIQAKDTLFGDRDVPEDTEERRELLLSLWPEPPVSLYALDKMFWKNLDQISDRCERFAIQHGLIPYQESNQADAPASNDPSPEAGDN